MSAFDARRSGLTPRGPKPRGLVVARSFLRLIAGSLALAATGAGAQTTSPLEHFDYVLGTQTFGPSYQFTAAPPLVETSRAIAVLGSNAIKFELKSTAGGEKTLTEMARDDPAVSAVLNMPFSYALMWAYPMTAKARLFETRTSRGGRNPAAKVCGRSRTQPRSGRGGESPPRRSSPGRGRPRPTPSSARA